MEKCCTSCGLSKPLTEFGKQSVSPDGLNYWCKLCQKEKFQAWYAKNKDKDRAKSLEWQKSNTEHRKDYWEQYRLVNGEKIKQQQRESVKAKRKNNPFPHRASSLKWREKNLEYAKAKSRAYYHNNKDRHLAHMENRRCRLRDQGGKFTTYEWKWLLSLCNNRCLACRKTEQELKAHGIPIERDHVNPFGRNSIENLQPLCKICNNKKQQTAIDYRPTHIRLLMHNYNSSREHCILL